MASVMFSAAGPPLEALYLMPKSALGPPGLWLAERMMPPKVSYLRMTQDAAGVDSSDGRFYNREAIPKIAKTAAAKG